jgi:hypothetical protein
MKVPIPLITALTHKFTLSDLENAKENALVLAVCYWPDGQSGRRLLWRGIPTADLITACRLLLSAAYGPRPATARRVVGVDDCAPPTSDSQLGSIWFGFERIKTYKWTTDNVTRKPIPPQSLVWRDCHSGKITLHHPVDVAQRVV